MSGKKKDVALFSGLNVLFYFVFLTGERSELIGYSRFMLHFMPSFFAGLMGFSELIKNTGKYFQYSLLFFIIVYNIYYSPTTFADRSNWGVYNCDTAEYYLPYPEAISYIAKKFPEDFSYIVSGGYYGYYITFYTNALKFNVAQRFLGVYAPDPALNLKDSIDLAQKEKADLLLFHNLNCKTAMANNLSGIEFIRRFSLARHCLDLYRISEKNQL